MLKADQKSECFNVNGPEAKLISGQTAAEPTEPLEDEPGVFLCLHIDWNSLFLV